MSYFHTPQAPLADAIEAIIGVNPGLRQDVSSKVASHYHGDALPMADVYHSNDLSQPDQLALSDFCAYFAGYPKAANWFTGDSVLEAAELIVQQAVENNNIEGSLSDDL